MSSQQVASHAGFFRGARFSSLPTKEQAFVGRDEERAPLKTSAWEATQQAIMT